MAPPPLILEKDRVPRPDTAAGLAASSSQSNHKPSGRTGQRYPPDRSLADLTGAPRAPLRWCPVEKFIGSEARLFPRIAGESRYPRWGGSRLSPDCEIFDPANFEPGHKVKIGCNTNFLAGACCTIAGASTLTSVDSSARRGPRWSVYAMRDRSNDPNAKSDIGVQHSLGGSRRGAGQPDGCRRSEFLKALGSDVAVLTARLRSLALARRRPADAREPPPLPRCYVLERRQRAGLWPLILE